MLKAMIFPAISDLHGGMLQQLNEKYDVGDQLPWGGLASFYRAEENGEPVVLQLLSVNVGTSRSAQAAFHELANSLRRANARALLPLLSYGIESGRPYFIFESVQAFGLGELLHEGPLKAADALSVAKDILGALVSLNDRGVIHADVTPSNVIVQRHDNTLRAFLLGSGIASLMRNHPTMEGATTRTGSGQYSIAYMAPELFGGQPYQHQADLYSIGALLQHMLTGDAPVGWESAEGYEDVPSLAPIVVKAMEHRTRDRYPHARAMLAALEWVEIESAKEDPDTQDIAPWMTKTKTGSISVPAIVSSRPPPAYMSHPPGTVLNSTNPDISGMHALGTFEAALDAEPSASTNLASTVEEENAIRKHLLLQVALLLTVLLGLIGLALALETTKSILSGNSSDAKGVTTSLFTRTVI